MGGSLIVEIRARLLSLGGETTFWHDISEYVKEVSWRVGSDMPYQVMGDDNTAHITLSNVQRIVQGGSIDLNGLFNPEETSSQLRETMKTDNRLRIRGVTTAGTLVIWRGRVERWNYEAGVGEQFEFPTPTITAYSNFARLKQRPLKYQQQTDLTADQVIGTVCALAGVQSTDRDAGTQVIPYIADMDMSAMDIISEATYAEYGHTYVTERDRIEHWNRHHIALAGTATPDGTIVSGTIDGAGYAMYQGMDYQMGNEYRTTYAIHMIPRTTSGTAITLWELDDPLTLQPKKSISFEARLRKADGEFVSAAAVSTSGISWTAGTGTVSATAYGGRADVTVTATGNAVATLGSLKLTGIATQRLNRFTYVRDDRNNELAQTLDVPLPVTDISKGKEIADWEAGRRGVHQPLVTMVPLRNGLPNDEADFQLQMTVGKKIRLKMDLLGHDRPYMVIGHEHYAEGTDKWLESRLYLEPLNIQYWDWETETEKTYNYGVYDQTNYDEAVYTL